MYDNFNFSHNIHFLLGNTKLKPEEIWEIDEMIIRNQEETRLNFSHNNSITYMRPKALSRYFPKSILQQEANELNNLKELRLSVHRSHNNTRLNCND
jgi:hypothetical protein